MRLFELPRVSVKTLAYMKYIIHYQQTQKNCMTFIQHRPNVFDVGPTLYKCYTNVYKCLQMLRISKLSS